MRRFIEVVLCTALLTGCGVAGQQRAINYARYGTEATGAAIDAFDQAADAAWCHGPITDTEAYCKCKRAGLVIDQSILVVESAADSIKVWETALIVYKAGKTDKGWSLVTKHAAEWFDIARHIVSVADAVRTTLELYGIKMPPTAAKVWESIAKIAPDGARDPVEWDWASLKGTICEVKP